jgi:hypothetical protein
VPGRLDLLREAVRRPLPLGYHPLYRFYAGGSLTGFVEGDFGRAPVRRGGTFALPASLPARVRAGPEPVRVVRFLGPGGE